MEMDTCIDLLWQTERKKQGASQNKDAVLSQRSQRGVSEGSINNGNGRHDKTTTKLDPELLQESKIDNMERIESIKRF